MDRKRAIGIGVIVALLAVAALTATGLLPNAFANKQLRIETVVSVDSGKLSELAVGEGSVWALDPETGIVYEVRPATNELGRVVETDQDSDGLEVADGRVWTVAQQKGYVSTAPLSGATGDLRRFTVVAVSADSNRRLGLRLHSEPDRVWVSSGVERPAIALDARSVAGYPPAAAASSLTNLTAIGGSDSELWGLTLDGRLARLSSNGDVEWDRRMPGNPKVEKIVVEESMVWLLARDRILRVDGETGDIRELDIEANDIAVGAGLLWVVENNGVRVHDAASAESLGQISTEVDLFQIEYADGSAWVLGRGGKILRISMNDEPLELTKPVQDDRIVYAYSADGDLWAEQADGDDVNLVISKAEDRRPSISPDGHTIAFQRGRAISGGVYFLDLSNGEERFLGHGGWPTYGHRDAFAYVSRGRGVYGINFVDGRQSTFVSTQENPANLSWTSDDRALYFVAGPPDRRVPYRISLAATDEPGSPQALTPDNTPAGASYPVATISDDRLYAVRACCRLPRAEIIYEFGYIDLTEPGRPFHLQLELTNAYLEEPISLIEMSGLMPPALGDPQRWTETQPDGSEDTAWLVNDGRAFIYLFKDGAWSFADQRLEHPGRLEFDGFSRAPLEAYGER